MPILLFRNEGGGKTRKTIREKLRERWNDTEKKEQRQERRQKILLTLSKMTGEVFGVRTIGKVGTVLVAVGGTVIVVMLVYKVYILVM